MQLRAWKSFLLSIAFAIAAALPKACCDVHAAERIIERDCDNGRADRSMPNVDRRQALDLIS